MDPGEVSKVMNPNIVAIIPARSGSKSIRDKNLALLNGYPLLAYSIVAAKMSRHISRVILSTDSENYAELGKKYGAEVPFLRPKNISTDSSTDREFMVHAMQWLKEHEGQTPEYWVHLRPTTPLRDPELIDRAIESIQNKDDVTSLRSAHLCPESPFKWFRKNDEGILVALASEDTSLDRFNGPRQSFPDVHIPDGYVDVVRRSFVMNTELLHGNRVLCFDSPFCIEVDSIEELDRLNYQIEKNGSPLLKQLEKSRGG